MFRIKMLGLLAIATTLVVESTMAQASAEGCTYVRCFLSLQRYPPRLVQGAAATPVADFGLFAPRVELLSTQSDSARLHYEAFRANYNRRGAFELLGIVIDVSSLVVLLSNPRTNYPGALGLFAVGATSELGSLLYAAKAQRQLEQSIAIYNRSLPDGR
jgi:hypothetical protein